jgi:uncharacterized membrane protein
VNRPNVQEDARTPSGSQAPAGPRKAGALRVASPFALLIVCAILYGVVFGDLTFLRFESYNSSVDDLGFYNQLMWITLHGGPSAWATYAQHTFHATYPWQTMTVLLLLPVYAVFPSPYTLLTAQAVGIPLATVPIYLLARRYNFSSWASFAFGGTYLINYQVESANLNDFHVQSFFPLVFFSMVLFYEYGWKKSFIGAGILAAATNPLTLALTLAFLASQLVRQSMPHPSVARWWARGVLWVKRARPEFWLFLCCAALLGLELWTGSIAGYHYGASTTQSTPGGYNDTLALRAVYLAMTFAPFLAVALLVPETIVLAVPLVLFLASTDVSYLGYYGHQDTLEFLVVALWGLMLFARAHRGGIVYKLFKPQRAPTDRHPGSKARTAPNLTVLAAVAISVSLFATLSPISPWNQVPGLLSDVNESPSNIGDVTSADHFLDSVAALIPSNASVLTQDNLPQLTGRYVFQWAYPGISGVNVSKCNYILADDSSNPFAQDWYAYLRPYVESGLNSGEFGVLAMGYGVMLLERGYHGTPQVTAPLPYSPSQLSLASGYVASGAAVHPPGTGSTFWFGPYVDLPAANYTATFQLMEGIGAPLDARAINVAVDNFTGPNSTTYATTPVYGYNFPAPNQWINFSVNFTLKAFVAEAEFPGLAPTTAAPLYLGGVTITLGHHAGPPYVRLPVSFGTTAFGLDSGAFVGNMAFHGKEADPVFWFGPYVDLPAGSYYVDFQLKIANVSPLASEVLNLAVASSVTGSAVFFNSSSVSVSQFSAANVWENLTLGFALTKTTYQVEFLGIGPTATQSIYFAGVTLYSAG